jgi:hypothetical protein
MGAALHSDMITGVILTRFARRPVAFAFIANHQAFIDNLVWAIAYTGVSISRGIF